MFLRFCDCFFLKESIKTEEMGKRVPFGFFFLSLLTAIICFLLLAFCGRQMLMLASWT